MAAVFEAIIYANGLQGCVYTEPFAGGAGAGIKLLESGHVDRLIINDVDWSLYCFWWSVMNRNDLLIEQIESVPLTIKEWRKQKQIYMSPKGRSRLAIGFAAFYLNRCNHSGIIKNSGPIGGFDQTGEWKIDARFNREGLSARVREIGEFADRIAVLHLDAKNLVRSIEQYTQGQQCIIYADPPYYLKGRELYLNHYNDDDHREFARVIQRTRVARWIVTYDNVPEIHQFYAGVNILPFRLRYSAHHASTEGTELLIYPDEIVIPELARERLSGGGFFRGGREETIAAHACIDAN
jgi:DNA adenine methylase